MTRAASLLVAFPGSLVYHLTLAIVLALLLGLAQIRGTRTHTSTAARWRLYAAGQLAVRMSVVGLAALAWLGVGYGSLLLSPLNLFAALAGVLLMGWGLLFGKPGRASDISLSITLAMSTLGLAATFGFFLLFPSSATASPSWPDVLWGLAGLVVSLAFALALVFRRPPKWGIGLSAFLVMSAAYGLQVWSHLWLGAAGSPTGFVRLGELAAYPLLALAAVRAMTASERSPLEVTTEAPRPSHEPRRGAPEIALLQDILALSRCESRADFAARAIQTVSRLMKAEYCLLLTAPDNTGSFTLAFGYDLISEQYVPGASLDAVRAPVISTAMAQRRTLALPSRSRSPDMHALQKALNLDVPGPAMMVPLEAEGDLYGGILILSPYARRDWSSDDRQALEALSGWVAARLRQFSLAEGEPVVESPPEVPSEAYQRIEALVAEAERLSGESPAPASLEARSEDLAALLKLNEEARETIQILEGEIERLKAAQAVRPSGTAEEVEVLTDRLQEVLQELAEARAKLAALEAGGQGRLPGEASPLDVDTVAAIVQEVRRPLATVSEYTDLLMGESVGPLGTMQRKFLERARGGVERIGILLNDLLRVTTIETGRLRLARGPVDMIECVEQALLQTGSQLRASNLTLRLDLPDELPPVLGDQGAIIQVLVHLIGNAGSASPEGSEISLSARAQPEGDAALTEVVALEVGDSGDGIPADQLGRVFQRPEEGDPAGISGVGESRVGLAIAKALIEAMAGRVWVTSQMGVGSTFTVLLPRALTTGEPAGHIA